MKKLLIAFLVPVLFFACKVELPEDPFAKLSRADVLKDFPNLDKGGVDGSSYNFPLVIPEEHKDKIQAISWSLVDSQGESVASKIDTVEETSKVWPSTYNFSFETPKLGIEDYKLLVTLYDSFVKEGDKYVFKEAKYKKSFVFEFFIEKPPISNDVTVVSLGAGQDTGISDKDNVTKINTDLTFCGETRFDAAIMDKPDTTVTFKLEKIGTTDVVESAPLTATATEADNLKKWEWKNSDTMSDGKWSVSLVVKYKNGAGDEVTATNLRSFIVIIDTVKPELFWRYKLKDDGTLDFNKDKDVALDVTKFFTVDFRLLKEKDGRMDIDPGQKGNLIKWVNYAFTDGSPISLSGAPGAKYFAGTNFNEINDITAEIQGFDPNVVGIQEVSLTAWDIAGNQADPIKRRLKVKEGLPKAIENADFNAAQGLTGWDDADTKTNSGKGAYTGWTSDIYVYRVNKNNKWGFKFDDAEIDNNSNMGRKNPVCHNLGYDDVWANCCYVLEDGGSRPLYFQRFEKITPSSWWSDLWYTGTGGKVFQEGFYVHAGIKYKLKGQIAVSEPYESGKEGPLKDLAVLYVESMATDDDLKVTFSGGGDYNKFVLADRGFSKEYRLSPLAYWRGLGDGTKYTTSMTECVLKFEPERSGYIRLGVAKQFQFDGVGVKFDNISLEAEFTQVTGVILTP